MPNIKKILTLPNILNKKSMEEPLKKFKKKPNEYKIEKYFY